MQFLRSSCGVQQANLQLSCPTRQSCGNVYNCSTVPIGSIVLWAGSTVPAGYLTCDGSSVAVTDYPKLYLAIGTSYGGSGSSFTLPLLPSLSSPPGTTVPWIIRYM